MPNYLQLDKVDKYLTKAILFDFIKVKPISLMQNYKTPQGKKWLPDVIF